MPIRDLLSRSTLSIYIVTRGMLSLKTPSLSSKVMPFLMIFISVLRKLSLLAGNNMVEFMSPIIVIDTANSAIG
ncbi:MAG: hypothetical protein BWX58_01226 [Deltaproteobacteria bacterium ADurb.Bin026]|nr:MAG: hypothetical protein BWX58_01226 [Deltaproteobacteria bacterium ADurb.Bin026]